MIRGKPANLTNSLKRMAEHQQMERVNESELHMAGEESNQATAVK